MRSFFTTNIWLKLASLILATTLWFFVILSGRSEIILDIPIAYLNIPSKLEIVDSPKSVSVRIKGQERLLNNLKQNEISAVIDLSEAKAGKLLVSLSKDNIKVPKTLAITNIAPKTISLQIKKQ